MRILLVDDHVLFLESLKLVLSSKGYDVVGTARNGTEGLQQARFLHPDLILMDMEMPGCDGLEATRLIKAEMPQIKIVILTFMAFDKQLVEAAKSGASGYLLKSQSADRLLDQLDHLAKGGVLLPPEWDHSQLNRINLQAQKI